MEKYEYLKEGDIITPEVELHDPEGKFWKGNDYTDTPVSKNWVGFFRRPVPHTGKVQFLMQISILVPVIVDCDGREQESIEAEAGELAYQKVLDDPRKYISYENVDWANCRVDELQPGFLMTDEYHGIDGKSMSLLSSTTLTQQQAIGRSVRTRLEEDEPRYRPFKEGDIIEKGDQVMNLDGEFEEEFSQFCIGDKILPSSVNNPRFRKLIK